MACVWCMKGLDFRVLVRVDVDGEWQDQDLETGGDVALAS